MQNHVHLKNMSNNSKNKPSWSIRTIGKPEDIELRSCGSPCPKVLWRIQISIIENHHQWIINIAPLLQHGPYSTRPHKNRLFFPRLRSGNGRLLIQFGFWCPETLWFFSKRWTRDCGSKLTPNESPARTCNLEPLLLFAVFDFVVTMWRCEDACCTFVRWARSFGFCWWVQGQRLIFWRAVRKKDACHKAS